MKLEMDAFLILILIILIVLLVGTSIYNLIIYTHPDGIYKII